MTSMYDSTTPWLIPASADYIAVYFNGLYAADLAKIEHQFPHARVFKIDVLGNAPAECGIADVENGDMTVADIPGWCGRRLQACPGTLCRLYCNRSTWPGAQLAVGKLTEAERDAVRWWIADPTGQAHQLDGADATQWYWGSGASNWDVSELRDQFVAA
jgi:hypothetical protein